jgi:hypothetical protein
MTNLLHTYYRRFWLHLVAIACQVVPLFLALTQVNPRDQTLFGLAPQLWNPLFLLCIGLGVGLMWAFWRCPACKHYLGRTTHPKACPQCGVSFRTSPD